MKIFPAIDIKDIAKTIIPKSKGGILQNSNQVEVISSININKENIVNNCPRY